MTSTKLQIALVGVTIAFIAWLTLDIPDMPNLGLQGMHRKVAQDYTDRFHIASRSGSAMDTCVAAGLVAAAHLQAKDEDRYRSWKKIETSACANAGISR